MTEPSGALVNVARRLDAEAVAAPQSDAVRWPRRRFRPGRGDFNRVTFDELAERSRRIGTGLLQHGLKPGESVCVFVRPGADLIAIVYGLLRVGAVPVLIDPGMGRKRLLACAENMRPKAFIGVPEAQVARLLFAKAFRECRLIVTVGRGPRLGGIRLEQVEANGSAEPFIADTCESDLAAILFTSGSTGPPKGVEYEHGNFEAQVRALSALYGFQRGQRDVAGFPLFALFDTALGMTSIFPALDPSHPARCNPANVHAAINENDATIAFGSPAIWRRIVPWCESHAERLDPLERILIAGAPVPPDLVESLRALLPAGGDVSTPYGATESLPVSSIDGAEIIEPALRQRSESGSGTCVGRPAPEVELRVVEVRDEPVEQIEDLATCDANETGEICVRGPVVTRGYRFDEQATQRARMRDASGRRWHRMGDLGYVDLDGRVWFCGRVSHRIETREGMLPPVPVEVAVNTHPDVVRSALVGIGARGNEDLVLIVEPRGRPDPVQILEYAAQRCATAERIELILFRKDFPVDVRHNAKIDRPALAKWAARELGEPCSR